VDTGRFAFKESTMAKTRLPYTPEFRRQMVELVHAGRTPEELAAEFEPTAQSIRTCPTRRGIRPGDCRNNAFRFSKVCGVIHSDDLHRSALPSAKNCLLFLWAPSPMLSAALSAMKAWGFIYKSGFVWTERIIGSDHPPDPYGWFRRRHELVLVGASAPTQRDRPSSPAHRAERPHGSAESRWLK
jgi:hypothetical protein